MAAPPCSLPTLRLSHTALGLSSRQMVLVLQVPKLTAEAQGLSSHGHTKCSAELFSQRWPGGGEKRESALSGPQSLLNFRRHTAGQPFLLSAETKQQHQFLNKEELEGDYRHHVFPYCRPGTCPLARICLISARFA